MCDKYLIFGTGSASKKQLDLLKVINVANFKIVAFVDNNERKWGQIFEGYPIIPPCQIEKTEFDYISIWSTYYDDIAEQLIVDFGIPAKKLKSVFSDYIEKCEKIQFSQCQDDGEKEESKEFFHRLREQHMLKAYLFSPENNDLHEVYYDEAVKMRYVIFEGKRMYLSRNYQEYIFRDGKSYINNIWYEQDVNSPHRYEEGDVCVKEGDVLLDAGVCEGNFTLHNIEKVKKAYLVECDPDWVEALRHTFAPYKDKVVIVTKFLSDEDTEEKIRIDSLIPKGENVNFLKMDIEGEEIRALTGGIETIHASDDFRCAVCSYHKHGDERKIKEILQGEGVQTMTSRGYMMFIYDEDMYEHPELRRGVVRGRK